MAQKANNYIVMAKYNGADFGKVHDRFSLVLRKVFKENKTRKVFITARPLTPHHPLLKIVYLEEHYMDVLSKTK